MISRSKTLPKTVALALFAALMLAHPWAMAGDAAPAGAAQASCAAGTADCAPAVGATDQAAARRHGQDDCERDPQSCDGRGKFLRSRADEEARDRHACRD